MILAGCIALFVTLPLVELAILLRVHSVFGLANTLGLVVVTGVAGAALAKSQGLRVLARIRSDLAAGLLPGPAIWDGVMILVAGIVLVTPGLLTDIAGFLLLVPAVRSALRARLGRRFERQAFRRPVPFNPGPD